MDLDKPIAEYASVKRWREGLAAQWGGDPLAEEPEKLAHLEAFCRFFGRDPDEAIAFCFLRKRDTGDRFASSKRRAELAEAVRRFRDDSGLEGVEARRLANDVLSFFIHGGVLIDPAMV